ncbi:MAG: hypothetical protein KC486_33170, partial [Myxococcales bacterium]|nr:hypothetical protein [Myxococcales bacterium]
MTRTVVVISATVLALAGCSGGDQETESESKGSNTTINVTITTSGTDTSSTTDTTTDSSTSSSSESEGTGTTGSECEVDEDCKDGFVCVEGLCEFDPTDCGMAAIEIPITTPNVVLVLDKSGSMVANAWDGDADPNTPDVTRWFSLYNVVDFIATQFNNSMNLGMVLYPSKKAKSEYNINACL